MKIETTADIAFPRDLVFATYRDKLPELVPYLANVREITVTSREVHTAKCAMTSFTDQCPHTPDWIICSGFTRANTASSLARSSLKYTINSCLFTKNCPK